MDLIVQIRDLIGDGMHEARSISRVFAQKAEIVVVRVLRPFTYLLYFLTSASERPIRVLLE
jgi:hypothetical protein